MLNFIRAAKLRDRLRCEIKVVNFAPCSSAFLRRFRRAYFRKRRRRLALFKLVCIVFGGATFHLATRLGSSDGEADRIARTIAGAVILFSFPIWMLLIVDQVLDCRRAERVRRRLDARRKQLEGMARCARCGYDLRGSALSRRCPECGMGF